MLSGAGRSVIGGESIDAMGSRRGSIDGARSTERRIFHESFFDSTTGSSSGPAAGLRVNTNAHTHAQTPTHPSLSSSGSHSHSHSHSRPQSGRLSSLSLRSPVAATSASVSLSATVAQSSASSLYAQQMARSPPLQTQTQSQSHTFLSNHFQPYPTAHNTHSTHSTHSAHVDLRSRPCSAISGMNVIQSRTPSTISCSPPQNAFMHATSYDFAEKTRFEDFGMFSIDDGEPLSCKHLNANSDDSFSAPLKFGGGPCLRGTFDEFDIY